jgi:hypothetical protein
MDSEAKIILAFLFNRSGKKELRDAELYLPLSMDLGWFSTKESQEFVKSAVQQGLLAKKDGMLTPTFALEDISIPIGFIPSKNFFQEKQNEGYTQNFSDQLLLYICSETKQKKEVILEEISRESQEKNIIFEVAALFVARKHDVDMSTWYSDIEQKIFKGNIG